MENKNMKDSIGVSLFAGENSVVVQNDEQQQEDEEDLEDQMRRQEELQNLIANAFNDMVFEDDHSGVNSSFESTNNSKYRSHISNDQGQSVNDYSYTDKNYKNTSLNSFEQLQVLYQVRVQESQKLAKELDELKSQLKHEQDAASRKILLLEGENKRINISFQQSQKLLVDKNEEIEVKSKEIEKLNTDIHKLTNSNEKLEYEVVFWKTNSNELEQKLHLIEKGINKTVSEKQIRSHYEQEIIMLQNTLQTTNSKLEKVEHECNDLQNQIQEIKHEKEVAVAEKVEIINSLTKSLEDSQTQCFSLLSKISSLQQDKQLLENGVSSKRDSHQNYEEVVITLRDELKRCLEEQNRKRQEINRLEELIKESHLKEKSLQLELSNKTAQENSKIQELVQENNNLLTEIGNLKQKIQEFEEQSKDSSKNSFTSEKYKRKREQYENLKQDLIKIEKQISDSINLKDRYIKCEQQCLNLQETVVELSSKLSESQIIISSLKEKLSLKDERDDLIETLKKKAEMFEDYMARKPSSVNPTQTTENATQTDQKNQQSDVTIKHLNELENIIAAKVKQIQILFEENKNLKEKIVFDRNSYTELSTIWTNETKKLNSNLCFAIERNEHLIKVVNELKKQNSQKHLQCDLLNTKINQARDYISSLELTSTKHYNHVLLEHELIKAKYEDTLGIIQNRLDRCIDVTNANKMF